MPIWLEQAASAIRLAPHERRSLASRRVCQKGTPIVATDRQCQGNARALMNAAEVCATAHRAVELRLDVVECNRRAMAFYEVHGLGAQLRIMRRARQMGRPTPAAAVSRRTSSSDTLLSRQATRISSSVPAARARSVDRQIPAPARSH